MATAEKFATVRLIARSWRPSDLHVALSLWGDPAVTALIDSRGHLTEAQVGEKLRAEVEREIAHGVQYWPLFEREGGAFVGCAGLRGWACLPEGENFELGFHIVKRCWGRGLATEAACGVLGYAWRRLGLMKVYAGHHPANRASQHILEKLGFRFLDTVFYPPTGLLHPSYICNRPETP